MATNDVPLTMEENERMTVAGTLRTATISVLLIVGLAGCVPEPAVAEGAPQSPAIEPADSPQLPPAAATTFVSVIDGDTIETSEGTVRIIGIDTPERGQCGYDEAAMQIGYQLSSGDSLTLALPPGQNDTDRHGRLLRYVTTNAGIDLGMMQLESGYALARYDSWDGYPAHPNEEAYRSAQLASMDAAGTVITTSCQSGAPQPVAPTAGDRWWEQFSSCTKLKKNTAGFPVGPFNRDDPAQAEAYEWFAYGTGNNGDGDGDGLACE
ncbi:thermonuclease family protein [Microbacterium sp. A82]|uniref:thermonuclease family protein n=1 Tax=Microbacterium sp. A82 TaxID=3450452 RepID=UPI003F2B4B0F